MRNTVTNFLAYSNGCIARRNLKARAWDWRWCNASSIVTEAKSGPKEKSIREQLFISPCQHERNLQMSNHTEVEVLLVEDNSRDAEMTLRTLRKRNLANHVVHVKDGQEALDWLLGTASQGGRDAQPHPKVVLLD